MISFTAISDLSLLC